MPRGGPMDKEEIHRKLDEIHEYARQTFQLFIGWFTFFVTVSYAAMGWLAKPDANSSLSEFVSVIPSMFISQNIVGMAACWYVWRCLSQYDERVRALEALIPRGNGAGDYASSIPMKLYSAVAALAVVALLIIGVSWGAILWFMLKA